MKTRDDVATITMAVVVVLVFVSAIAAFVLTHYAGAREDAIDAAGKAEQVHR